MTMTNTDDEEEEVAVVGTVTVTTTTWNIVVYNSNVFVVVWIIVMVCYQLLYTVKNALPLIRMLIHQMLHHQHLKLVILYYRTIVDRIQIHLTRTTRLSRIGCNHSHHYGVLY